MVTKYLDKEGLLALIRLVKRGLDIELPDLTYLDTIIDTIEQNLGDLREKKDVYTKQETNDLISKFPHFQFEDVDELPDVEDAREDVIYLVPNPDGEEENGYLEYVLVNGEFEQVGTSVYDLDTLYEKDDAYAQEEADELIIPEITAQKVYRLWFGLPDYFTLDISKLDEGDTLA